jgi:thiamine transport system permease protein
MEGRWDKAVLLAGFQSLLLFLFSLALPQSFWPQKGGGKGLRYLACPHLRSLPFLPLGILLLGWSQGLGAALKAPALILPEGLMIEAILTTAFLAMATGVVHLVLFLVVAFISPHERLGRFLNGYLAPSPTIAGFGLILIPVEGDWINLFKLVTAVTLISFPLLYRWIVHATLKSLDKQVAVARALGASWSMILLDVVWPQTAPQILRASGMAALWAAGDFALSGILLGEGQSLPLVMESLLGNYQIESAQGLLIPLVLVGSFAYALFQGASRYVAS